MYGIQATEKEPLLIFVESYTTAVLGYFEKIIYATIHRFEIPTMLIRQEEDIFIHFFEDNSKVPTTIRKVVCMPDELYWLKSV